MLLANKLAYVPSLAEKTTDSFWVWAIRSGVVSFEIVGLSIVGAVLMILMMWAVPTGRERLEFLLWWATALIGTNTVFGVLQWWFG